MSGDSNFYCGNHNIPACSQEILAASFSHFTSVSFFLADVYSSLVESWSDLVIRCWDSYFKVNIVYVGAVEVVRLTKCCLESSLEGWLSFIQNLVNILFFHCVVCLKYPILLKCGIWGLTDWHRPKIATWVMSQKRLLWILLKFGIFQS